MLGRQHTFIEDVEDESFVPILSNTNLSEYFLALGQDLEIMEAKTPGISSLHSLIHVHQRTFTKPMSPKREALLNWIPQDRTWLVRLLMHL